MERSHIAFSSFIFLFFVNICDSCEGKQCSAARTIPVIEAQITKTSKKNLTQIFPFHFLGDLNQLAEFLWGRRIKDKKAGLYNIIY